MSWSFGTEVRTWIRRRQKMKCWAKTCSCWKWYHVILTHSPTCEGLCVNVAFHHDMMKTVESHCHLLRPHCLGKNETLATFRALQFHLDKFTLDLVISLKNSPMTIGVWWADTRGLHLMDDSTSAPLSVCCSSCCWNRFHGRYFKRFLGGFFRYKWWRRPLVWKTLSEASGLVSLSAPPGDSSSFCKTVHDCVLSARNGSKYDKMHVCFSSFPQAICWTSLIF